MSGIRRVALVQYDPIFKNPQETISKVQKMIESITNIDVYIFPEMSLVGYCFDKDIDSVIDETSIEFGRDVAKRKNAYVQIGFPRKEGTKYYNSVAVIDRQGNTLCIYDKHFLYEQDENWASEGSGFKCIDLEFGRVGLGICMDLNPKQFKAPFDAFEFANFQKAQRAQFLFLSMAWLFAERENPFVLDDSNRAEKELEMINYWGLRLLPLIKSKDPIFVFIANRTGIEGTTCFGGVSCCLRIQNGKCMLIDHLNAIQEKVLVIDIGSQKLTS